MGQQFIQECFRKTCFRKNIFSKQRFAFGNKNGPDLFFSLFPSAISVLCRWLRFYSGLCHPLKICLVPAFVLPCRTFSGNLSIQCSCSQLQKNCNFETDGFQINARSVRKPLPMDVCAVTAVFPGRYFPNLSEIAFRLPAGMLALSFGRTLPRCSLLCVTGCNSFCCAFLAILPLQ